MNDVIMPPIGLLIDNVDFSPLYINLADVAYPSLAAAKEASVATINYGAFVNEVINFLIIAIAIFMAIKAMNSMKKQEAEAPAEPPKLSAKVELLTEIRDSLQKS